MREMAVSVALLMGAELPMAPWGILYTSELALLLSRGMWGDIIRRAA